MILSVKVCLISAVFLLYLVIMLICIFCIQRLRSDKDRIGKEKGLLLDTLLGKEPNSENKIQPESYFEMRQSIYLDRKKTENVEKCIDAGKLERKQIRKLASVFQTSRSGAAMSLGLLGTEKARLALEKAILKDKNAAVRLYMANALSEIGKKESIPVLIASLSAANRWYREKVNMLIADFGEDFHTYLPKIIDCEEIEIMELIVDFSTVYFSENLKAYLIRLVNHKEEVKKRLQDVYKISDNRFIKLPDTAADILSRYYPKVLNDGKYLDSEDSELRNTAVKALSNINSRESMDKLLYYIREEKTAGSAISSISRIIENNPEYINIVVQLFNLEQEELIKERLAEVLSGRIEYFIMKLQSRNTMQSAQVIKKILLLGRSSEVIDFMNKNKDIDLENELIAILKEAIPESEALKKQLTVFLNERLLRKCGLIREDVIPGRKEEKKDKKLIASLFVILVLTIMIFPAIYVIRRFSYLFTLPLLDQLKVYVVDFNYYLAFYSITINTIYIVLLLLSFFQMRQQSKRWKIKSIPFLFKKKILPSISVIAPAFNEEMTIIESANSLLNLKYPDYELIIVNDGSKDSTLEVLIKYYDLVRVDYPFEYKLKTKQVRGIYINRSMPKLIIVDKENGGKADSLNAGINISSKEYFCGIDADSLLEDEALLRLSSLTLDKSCETPALGGNIFPINGCSIERGHIKNIRIPDNKLARFQTIEYIRSFMAGRLGWASLNSLLIISGAFGLFRKERVINTGGYLTSSGKYAKDTVGEDMELVVRISRLMRELGSKFRICYAFNANCWTEVPEDLKSLKRQRYRWHRGLIDILTFHRKMLFNPRYGRTGLFAMPYFFIFEMIGPLVEFQGYVMVLAAFLLGLLNAQIALLLFVSTVLMGVLISVASLLIAEKDIRYFRWKDIFILIAYSIIENFGPRQLFSFWRVGGFFKMLGKQGGWGKPERKGFTASKTAVKV